MQTRPIDEIDKKLMTMLAQDARISNRAIATELNITEGTVRARIKRLEKSGYMRITAITNMSYMDKPQLAFIGIDAEHNMIEQTAAKITTLDEINAVLILLGRFDILAIGLFSGLEQVQKVASDKILAIAGVRHVETTIISQVIKYNSGLAKIVE